MTLGEKIKNARKNAGLTQEQMAEKLMISRPAITKWEADRGIPDIENLKAISKLLDVSIDYLLSVDEETELNAIREPIHLGDYGKGWKAKEKIVCEKYPNAVIMMLASEKKLTKGEKVIDNLVGFLTDAPFGIPDMIHYTKMLDKCFYLVEQDDKQYLVTVDNEFIETRRIQIKVANEKRKSFQIGEMKYTVCGQVHRHV